MKYSEIDYYAAGAEDARKRYGFHILLFANIGDFVRYTRGYLANRFGFNLSRKSRLVNIEGHLCSPEIELGCGRPVTSVSEENRKAS